MKNLENIENSNVQYSHDFEKIERENDTQDLYVLKEAELKGICVGDDF